MQRSRRTLSGHPGRRGGPKPPSPTAGMAPATRPGPRADGGRKAPAVHPRPPSPHVPGSGAVPHARLGIVRPWPERRCPHAAVQDHAPHRATTCRLRMRSIASLLAEAPFQTIAYPGPLAPHIPLRLGSRSGLCDGSATAWVLPTKRPRRPATHLLVEYCYVPIHYEHNAMSYLNILTSVHPGILQLGRFSMVKAAYADL